MSLLDRFREDSDFEAHGQFTLDGTRARDKMAHFQLAREEDFLLLLIQACVAAGCGTVEISITESGNTQRVGVSALQIELEHLKLENLEESLFDEDGGRSPYTLLGIALNSVQILCAEEPQRRYHNSRLELELVLSEPLESLVDVVKERVRFAPCQVSLNKANLPQTPVDGIGPIQFLEDRKSVAHLVRHGVLIEKKQLEFLPAFVATVDHPDFKLDASFTHIIEDELFQSVLDLLYQKMLEAVEQASRLHTEDDRCKLLRWMRELPASKIPVGLWGASVFAAADREQTFSLRELSQQCVSAGFLYTSTGRIDTELGQVVVLASESQVRETLKKFFTLKDSQQLVRDRHTYLKNREKWERSPRPLELPPGSYKSTKSLTGKDWQASLGLSVTPSRRQSLLHIHYQGRFLNSEDLSSFVPPGSHAVLNLDKAIIDSTWSQAAGRTYLQAKASIEEQLGVLFQDLEPFSENELSSDMRRYLLEKLEGETEPLPRVVTETPLFPGADGLSRYSLAQLASSPSVHMGKPFRPLSTKFPTDILPQPLLAHDDEIFNLLNRRLPSDTLFDFQPALERFTEIDKQLLNPSGPTLPPLSYLVRETLSHNGVKAHFGLTSEKHQFGRLALYHNGVCLEEKEVILATVVTAQVAVECGDLVPKTDWSGYKRDARYTELERMVREKVREMEQALVFKSRVPESFKISLLLAYPELVKQAEEIPLFLSADGGERYSIKEVTEQHAQLGCILTSIKPVSSARVKVLRVLAEEPRTLLNQIFGKDLKLKLAQTYLGMLERKASFEEAAVQERIGLAEKYLFKESLDFCEGELGIFPEEETDRRGELRIYVERRLGKVKSAFLPPVCNVALQHPELQFTPNMSDIPVSRELREKLLALCEQRIFSYLTSENWDARRQAFEHLRSLDTLKAVPSTIHEYPVLNSVDGSKLPLKQILTPGQAVIARFVTPELAGHIDWNSFEELFIQTDLEMEILRRVSEGFLQPLKMNEILRKRKRDKEYLHNLPLELPEEYDFHDVQGALISAKLRMSETSSLLGFDVSGRVLGYAEWEGLPVSGHIHGLLPVPGQDETPPRAGFQPQMKNEFRNLVGEFYLDWFERAVAAGLTSEARSAAVRVLFRLAECALGRQEHPEGRLAQFLWDLPLFRLQNETCTSGSALATRLSDSQAQLLLARPETEAPGDAVILEEFSTEHGILIQVLGEEVLTWYEAPGLLDPAQLKRRIQEMATWGLSPLRSLSKRLGFDTHEGKPKPEAVLLVKLHEDLEDLLGAERAKEADGHFCRTDFGIWLFGPPLYRSLTKGHFRFNRRHPAIRWLMETEVETREHRVARMLLLVRWIALVNEESETLTDQHESEFLVHLSERIGQTLG